MSWQDEFPLTKKLEQVWEGCGWAEGLEPDTIDEPLLGPPELDRLDEWRKETEARRKRYWGKAERYFEQHPEEYEHLLNLGMKYKREGWLQYV